MSCRKAGRIAGGVTAQARRKINADWSNADQGIDWPQFLNLEVYPLEMQQGSANLTNTTWAVMTFSDLSEQDAFFIIRLPLGYKSAGTVRAKIMWWDDGSPPGNVKWQLEYEKKGQGHETAFASSSTTSIVDNYSGDGFVNEIDITDSMALTTTGWGPGDTIFFKVIRLSGDDDDTYDDVINLGQIQFEYEADRIGAPS